MKQWYALYTKPHKEHQVDGLLQEAGIETYLPTVQRKPRRRDRPDRIVYFPCYLFARLDLEDTPLSTIAWMPGMRNIVSAGEKPVPVSDELIEVVRRRLRRTDSLGYHNLRRGDAVRITSGPLRDLEAVFDQPLSATNRVRILLEVMGSMTAVTIDYKKVKRI